MCPDLVDLFLEVVSPVLRQCRDTDDALQPLEIVPFAGIEPRDLRDRYGTAGSFDQEYRVSLRESENVASFHLVPEDERPLPPYLPGQYRSCDLVVAIMVDRLLAPRSKLGFVRAQPGFARSGCAPSARPSNWWLHADRPKTSRPAKPTYCYY